MSTLNIPNEFDYILIDLDGTLIKMDELKFANEYFKLLGSYFKDIIEPDKIFSTIMLSVEEISKNPDGINSNYERFLKTLYRKLNLKEKITEEDLKNMFNDFYKNEFPKLSTLAEPNYHLVNDLRRLKNNGKKLVLATNPLFPKIAILERLRWSTMKPEEFTLITYMENSKYCKPDVRYFIEICDRLTTTPQKCVMIGNDSQYDSSCENIGIKYIDVRNLT